MMMMVVVVMMMMFIIIMIMIWMSEGASRAQASRAIPCTSEPKSRAHTRRLPTSSGLGRSWILGPATNAKHRWGWTEPRPVIRALSRHQCTTKVSPKLVGISTIYIRDNDNGVKLIQCMFKHVQTIWRKFGCAWRSVTQHGAKAWDLGVLLLGWPYQGTGQVFIEKPTQTITYNLVGGFNHLEKCESQWEGLSDILLWKINNVWTPQPAMFPFSAMTCNKYRNGHLVS